MYLVSHLVRNSLSHNQVHPTNLLLGFLLTSQSISLGEDTLLSSLTGSLGLGTLSVHLLLEDTLTLLLGLGLVDLFSKCQYICLYLPSVSSNRRGKTNVFNESTLVLEGVTLAQVVELVVEVLVDLTGGTVLDEETAENTLTTHPEDLTVDEQY